MIFAGVPVGVADLLGGEKFTPELTVANFASTPAGIAVAYSPMSANASETKIVSRLNLAPGMVQELELTGFSGDPGMRNSLVITSNAQPGAVISNLVSRGQELYPAVQLIGKDALDVNNGGGHPWSIANGDESTLFLFNHAAKPVAFTVNIAAGGVFWNQRYKLAPNETYSMDIRAAVAKQVPDLHGNKLPADAIAGDASWFTPGHGEGTGRLLVSNVGAGLARNFSCGSNIVLCGSYLGTSTATFPVGGTGSLGPIYGNECTAYSPTACSGQSYCTGCAGGTYNWTSLNNEIAPISGPFNGSGAAFYGQAGGSAIGQGQIYSSSCSFISDGTLNVQVPTSLNVISATSLECPGSQNYGIQIKITYQVMDQNNPPNPIAAAGMDPWEQGTYISGGSYGPLELGSPTGANGQFVDSPVGVCQNLPLTKPFPGGTQNITIKWNNTSYAVRTNHWTETIPSGTPGFGHGTITNGSDINVSR